MRKCPQCQQIYNDDTNFCLTDGATLVSVSDSFITESDMPTVVREAAPTVYNPAQTQSSYGLNQPPSYSGAPFVPPVSSAPPAKSNTLLIAVLVGLIALVAGGAMVGLIMYGLSSSDNKNTNAAGNTNSADQTNRTAPDNGKTDADERAEKLKREQEKLDRDKQKLEEERKRLETQKKQSQPTPPQPPPNSRTAIIIDPPSNIRAAPNGTIICVARTRGTVVNILGSTGVSDNNGTWYYTDYCGRQGVIHSTQIRF